MCVNEHTQHPRPQQHRPPMSSKLWSSSQLCFSQSSDCNRSSSLCTSDTVLSSSSRTIVLLRSRPQLFSSQSTSGSFFVFLNCRPSVRVVPLHLFCSFVQSARIISSSCLSSSYLSSSSLSSSRYWITDLLSSKAPVSFFAVFALVARLKHLSSVWVSSPHFVQLQGRHHAYSSYFLVQVHAGSSPTTSVVA